MTTHLPRSQAANPTATTARAVPFPVARARAHFRRAVLELAEQPTPHNVARYLVASRVLDAVAKTDPPTRAA
jgi:hypothetical protein